MVPISVDRTEFGKQEIHCTSHTCKAFAENKNLKLLNYQQFSLAQATDLSKLFLAAFLRN